MDELEEHFLINQNFSVEYFPNTDVGLYMFIQDYSNIYYTYEHINLRIMSD
jgi:hypothetical protein